MNESNNHSKNVDDKRYDALRLDNQLCFALYVCSKEIIKKYKPLLDPLNITYTGYITLMALWEQDNVSVKELGNRLFLDSGTLTPLLKKLESAGFIKRIRSSIDERNVYIQLTKEGYDFQEKAKHIPKELVCSMDVDPNEGYALLTSLHKMMTTLN